MRFRWTAQEVADASDDFIIRSLLVERMATLGENSPYYKRLKKMYDKLDRKILLAGNKY